jgi:hypothetical protein
VCVHPKILWIGHHLLSHSSIVSERCRADSRWSALLEPGPLALLRLTAQLLKCVNDNDGKQVDDDGESYWIFESKDVGCLLLFPFFR